VLVAALTIVLVWRSADRLVVRPVAELARGTARIRGGDFGARLTPHGSRELADLAESFNDMAAALERNRRERATAEGRLTQFVERMPMAVILCDAAGAIVHVNGAARATFPGLADPGSTARGDRFPLLLGSGGPPHDRPLERALAGEDVHIADARILIDGRAVPFELWASPIVDGDGRIAFAFLIAVERARQQALEAELRQLQKMEAVGRLAGGIAHDFNNLLTVILGYAEILIETAREEHRSESELNAIFQAADRARTLTQQLLAFGRRQVLRPQVVDPNALITNIVGVLGRVLGEDVRLELRLDESVARVRVDPGQFDQIVLNIAANARDAMPGGGRLVVSTATTSITANGRAADLDVQAGTYVQVSFADSGGGMSPEVQARIFEPFFTTKPFGQGTGLGLATVYGIVRQSHGGISVESSPGTGTTIHVYLPAVGVAAETS
jgi:signal transduction histidine kinase